MKTVSVITPTANRQDELFDCIQSVVDQTYGGEVEHIIVSDRSEFVRKNVARLKKQSPNLTIMDVDQDKCQRAIYSCYICSRLGFIRNSAVAAAKGYYVCYVDDDNRLDPSHIASLVEAIESEPDIDIAYSWRYLVWEDGTPYLEEEYPWTPEARLAVNKQALSRHIYNCLVDAGIRTPGSNLVKDCVITKDGDAWFTVDQGEFMLRKELQLKIPFSVKYPWRKMVGDYSDDHDFIERAHRAGCKFKCTEKATLYYTIGGCSQDVEKNRMLTEKS